MKEIKYIGLPKPYENYDIYTDKFTWWSFIKALIKGFKISLSELKAE